MTVKILEQEANTATIDLDGRVYRVSNDSPTISRFGVAQWAYPVDTPEWCQVVQEIRADNEALFYELFGPEIDATHREVIELWRDKASFIVV